MKNKRNMDKFVLRKMARISSTTSGRRYKEQLTLQQIAVGVGLLSNALSVNSVLVDRDQNIIFVVAGSISFMKDFLKESNMKIEDLIKL